ncbi:uncharacterized protein [Diabrotica undecimpunctata]|uniref:uncharacterized protein n=1 Tax=Diabrotica undecimpunctata TaxID=50387 RepID=UPI003B640539
MQKTIILTSSQYQLLRPIIWICKYFCILPFAIKKTGNVWWIYSSWWSVITGVIGVVTIATSILYGIYIKYNMDVVFKLSKSNSFGTKLVNVASITTLMTTFFICYISSNLNFKYLQEYFVHLTKVDDFIKFVPSAQKSKTFTKILYYTILTKMLIYMTDLAVWGNIASPQSSITFYLIRQLPLYVLFFTMEFATIYYNFLVKYIDDRLQYLNTSLRNYYCYNKSPGKISTVDDISKYDAKFFLQNDSMFDKNSEPFDRTKINYLMGYECLFECSIALNNYFGAKLLILLFGVCFYLLRHPYDLYVAILNQQYLLMFLQALWIIGHVWRLLLLIEPCNSVAQEVQKMSLIVCKILSHKTEIEFNDKLQLLLSMLDRCPIKFTSCHLFSMDRHLLTSIAGGVTTYLVILLQFGE